MAFITSYFVHQIQPKLRSENFSKINFILPNKKQLYSIVGVSFISTFLIFFIVIDGPGTSDDEPNYRLGLEDVNLETIEVHSLSNPVNVEVINVGEESVQLLLIKTSIAEKHAEKGIFDWEALSSKGELFSLSPKENTSFSVTTESIYDSYIILSKLKNPDSCSEFSDCEIMKNSVGEIRIITHYFDDELIWSAYLVSLPSFYIVGYVLGMSDKEIMSIKTS